jgi:hypothetical protein
MRKTTICLLLLLLCSLAAFGQAEPQWKVVQHGALIHQTTGNGMTLFNPSTTGIYRMSAYISASEANTNWRVRLGWVDFGGLPQAYVQPFAPGAPQIGSFMFVPKAGTPVTYIVEGNDLSATYNIAFTVEKLQ